MRLSSEQVRRESRRGFGLGRRDANAVAAQAKSIVTLNGDPIDDIPEAPRRFIEALCRARGYLDITSLKQRVYVNRTFDYTSLDGDTLMKGPAKSWDRRLRANRLAPEHYLGWDYNAQNRGFFQAKLDADYLDREPRTRPIRYEWPSRAVTLEDQDGMWDAARPWDPPNPQTTRRSWNANDVTIVQRGAPFTFQGDAIKSEYREFCHEIDESNEAGENGSKFMLAAMPSLREYSRALRLVVRPVLWYETRYFSDVIARDGRQARPFLERVRGESDGETLQNVDFPHAFCMHLVALTSDRHVIGTKRSPKSHFYPDHLSCSLEEQLEEEDFRTELGHDSASAMVRWCDRALRQELGLDPKLGLFPRQRVESTNRTGYFNEWELRVVGLVVMEDTLSVALAALVTLTLSADDLRRCEGQLRRARDGDLIGDLRFFGKEDLHSEFRKPSRLYHPSSRYRMNLAIERIEQLTH